MDQGAICYLLLRQDAIMNTNFGTDIHINHYLQEFFPYQFLHPLLLRTGPHLFLEPPLQLVLPLPPLWPGQIKIEIRTLDN